MKPLYAAFAVLLCCVIYGPAQDVSITGTVTGGGAPLQGARVSVKNYPHLVAYTDAAGAFSLSGALPVINGIRTGNISVPFIANGKLLFDADKNSGTVRIDLFSLRGDRIFSRELANPAPGTHAIRLMKTAQGVFILRFTSGTGSYVMKMTAGTGSAPSRWQGVLVSSSTAKAAAGLIDTLVVTAPSWRHAVVGLPDHHQQQVAVTLAASNPWKPSGPLEHENGMVKIMAKGYDFEMGQPDPNIDSIDATVYEQPINTVQFTYDFWMDTTEVTQKVYDSIMGQVYESYVPVMWDPWFGLGDSFPVYSVYWGNAALYCNARSKLEGFDTVYSYDSLNAPPGDLLELFGEKSDLSKNGYRLPTEAEWEYAYKAGTVTDFFWGKNYGPYPATLADSTETYEYSVWWGNSFRFGDGNPGSGNHPAGSTKPNAYGIYEMAGNVTEFCQDFWADDFRRSDDWGTVVDPTGPATGTWRGHVFRGANWGSNARSLRSAYRNPYFDQPDYTIFFVGFRVVRPIR